DRALRPRACRAMVKSAIVTCSPVESSMSISRRSGAEQIRRASVRRPSVVLPMAETTTTSWLPGAHSATRRAPVASFSASAPDDPPNFWTSSAMLPKPTRPVGASQSSDARAKRRAGSRRARRVRVGSLSEAYLLAEQIEPAGERDGHDLAGMEEQRVADCRRVRDAEAADRQHRRGVEDADVARSGGDRDPEPDEGEHRPAGNEGQVGIAGQRAQPGDKQ